MNSQHIIAIAALAASALSFTGCRSTLYYAARDGDVKTVREELADGADVEDKVSDANRLWQVPATVIALPLDIGLRIVTLGLHDDPITLKALDYGKKTPIGVATDPDVITELLLAGAEGTDWDMTKAITEAARRGNAATLEKLLQVGCDTSKHFKDGYTALMLAIGAGHEDCARILLEYGAEFGDTVKIKGEEISCYDYAVSMGQEELYKKLGGTIAAAPSSIAGKRISFDYSSAQYRDDEMGSWGDWQKSKSSNTTSKVFGKNNKAFNCKSYGSSAYWSYTKTGNKTATVENGIPGESDMGFPETYKLTFDSDNSGTAVCESGGEGWCSEEIDIHFTINGGNAKSSNTYYQDKKVYSKQHLDLLNDRTKQVNGAIADIDKAMTYTTRISAATYASTKRDADSLLQLTAKEIAAARAVKNAQVNAAATTLERRRRVLQQRMDDLKAIVR